MAENPHGSLARATTGRCRCDICHAARSRYSKRWLYLRSQGVEFVVDAAPTLRKLGALRALGHTGPVIAERMGISVAALSDLFRQKRIKATTACKAEEVYRELEMAIPPDNKHTRATRTRARNRGFHPPLAWEDIDAGILAKGERVKWSEDRLDEELVEYVLLYRDFEVRTSQREKFEIVRRWTRSIGSERQLCALTGWRPGRYAPHNNPYNTQPTQEAS